MNTQDLRIPIEIWGGVECTVNRVRDRYFNQLDRSGHYYRSSDLEQFAKIGLRTLRFPLLWETLAPTSPDQVNWSWADERLDKLRALGIRPIVGLLHHGSGPRYTDLTDPLFPEKFAAFAAQVARRYPWIDAYTPINEPLTTARFSGLYGHWYPHARDDRAFVAALLNQVRGTMLAMREIRAVNPSAQLVQTEDLGRTFSTRKMQYQADFDNERRWLTWDLLTAGVHKNHSMWNYLTSSGATPADLDFFSESRCRVDVLGINHYITSDRYLDENIRDYPPELHGRNGRQSYADDAAVRARAISCAGFRTAIAEAHKRYALPIALTEVHLGCTVAEQICWFQEAWEAAKTLRARGATVRAVTAWALLGSFDWDSLVTRDAGHYEAGAFDLSTGYPQPTALAKLLATLAKGHGFCGPAPLASGWWRKRSRFRSVQETEQAA